MFYVLDAHNALDAPILGVVAYFHVCHVAWAAVVTVACLDWLPIER